MTSVRIRRTQSLADTGRQQVEVGGFFDILHRGFDFKALSISKSKMNVIQEIERIKEAELANGIYGGLSKGSWHEKYSDSAWVYLGGFSYELSEGDIICVMSQWGEIEDINLIRDKATGKSQGFAFVKYEDQRSTILAVDNFNGIKLLGRVLRCDHVDKYKLPKDIKDAEAEKLANNPDEKISIGPGHAYEGIELENEHDISKGVDLWNPSSSSSSARPHVDNEESNKKAKKEKKEKKDKKDKKMKKEKKEKHHHRDVDANASNSDRESDRDGSPARRTRRYSDEEEEDRRGRREDSRDRSRERSGRGDSRDRRDRSRDRGRRSDSRSRNNNRGRDDYRRGDRGGASGSSSGSNRRDAEAEAEAEEARRLAALHAEKQAASTHRAFGGSASVGAYKGPVLPPGEG